MTNELISALISLIGASLGTVSGILINSKLTSYRIEQLEKKVDKHNSLIERTFLIERHIAVNDETIRVVNHRISDLENKLERSAHA